MQTSLARLSWNDSKSHLYLGLIVAGKADESFVTVFKDGQYQNTLSGGITLNFFPAWASAKFYPVDRWETKSIVNGLTRAYHENRTGPSDRFAATALAQFLDSCKQQVLAYSRIRKDAEDKIYTTETDPPLPKGRDTLAILQAASIAEDTLIVLGYLKPDFKHQSEEERIKVLNSLRFDAVTLRAEKYLKAVNKQFMNADWSSYSMHWFTVKPTFNTTSQNMIDLNNADNQYLSTYVHRYFSVDLAYNYTKKWFTLQLLKKRLLHQN